MMNRADEHGPSLHTGVGMLFALLLGCGESSPEAKPEATPTRALTDIPRVAGFAQSVEETAPADNQLSEARAQLGRRLFYDVRLSSDETVACSSCHQQANGFADSKAVSLGVQGREGKRNAPQLANLAWVRTGLFWDGRVATLEEQASLPIADHLEMDLELSEAIARLEGDPEYVRTFAEAYDSPVNVELLEKALASFVRTLVSAHSPYDAYVAGDPSALSAAAERGLSLFLGKAGCFHCHSEQTLTNDGFFNNGTYVEGGDVGRQSITGRTGDLGKFRVPNLRNIAVTAPYMHDGSLESLDAVVAHYTRGGQGHPSTDAQIEPVDLTQDEQQDLAAFLESLTDRTFLNDERYGPPGN